MELGAEAGRLCLDSFLPPLLPPSHWLGAVLHRHRHTSRLVIASVSYFLHLPPGTKEPGHCCSPFPCAGQDDGRRRVSAEADSED